jgi:cytidylate kinase
MEKYRLANETEARRMIERVDRDRDRFLREMTGYGLTDSCHYDLCINTAHVAMETAEEMVVRQVERVR